MQPANAYFSHLSSLTLRFQPPRSGTLNCLTARFPVKIIDDKVLERQCTFITDVTCFAAIAS